LGTLLGIAHFRFHPGKVDEFKRLSLECVDIVKSLDTGTLRYDVYLNADHTEATVVEEYVDEQALIEHGQHIGEVLAGKVIATGDVHGELLGEASEELRARLASGPVQLFTPVLRGPASARQPSNHRGNTIG